MTDGYVAAVREHVDERSARLIEACERELAAGVTPERARALLEVIDSRRMYLRRQEEADRYVVPEASRADRALKVIGIATVVLVVTVVLPALVSWWIGSM